MYIEKLIIKGYRIFNEEFAVTFNKGLNIIIGENASGKSTVIDAIRLILLEDEFGKAGINDTDFHRPISQPSQSKGVDRISIKCQFSQLSQEEQVIYLPWLDLNNPEQAYLNLAIENKEDNRGKFKRKVWGNESQTGLFEWELLNRISCIYLPPLRDAEDKLRAYKGSRLARLLKSMKTEDPGGAAHPLEQKFATLNKSLLQDETVKSANKFIRDNIINSVGSIFGQDASLQFSEINFDRIVERIRLLFYPNLPQPGSQTGLEMFRELNENSLGYNNILYLATILAEFEGASDEHQSLHKILLIEEPEAHLHPQLQIRLLQYLNQKASENKIQIIVTSHSPTLSSSVNLDAIKVMTIPNGTNIPSYTSVSKCGYSPNSKNFLERWLDITKALLFYAKGILFVEGIAESLVMKELSKYILRDLRIANPQIVYHDNLEEYGISIISLNGIYFDHFFPLFQGYKMNGAIPEACDGIPIKCSGLTDNDPPKIDRPTPLAPVQGTNSKLYLVADLAGNSANCRLFSNLKTFEYDLALEENNLSLMAAVFLQLVTTNGPIRRRAEWIRDRDWSIIPVSRKAIFAYWLLDKIEGKKGEFAQLLAQKLSEDGVQFRSPQYIIDAIKWLVE